MDLWLPAGSVFILFLYDDWYFRCVCFDCEIALNKDSLLSFFSFSEVKLSLASFLSDRIVDEILEALSGSQNTLVSSFHRRMTSKDLLIFFFLFSYGQE